MTVVVAFLCTDGIVVAADSMITPSIGGINVGHHHGRKVGVLRGPQVWAFAGDQGQAARFQAMADGAHAHPQSCQHVLEYPIALSASVFQQFTSTGIGQAIAVNTILGYLQGSSHHCCVFEGAMQPRLLDAHHYYVALGSGKLSADPFLRFLVDVYCDAGQPSVRLAKFLSYWAIQHVIDTNSGGVDGPIRIATLERDSSSAYVAHELTENELAEYDDAMKSAIDALRAWRDVLQGANASLAPQAPPLPNAPSAAV